MTRKFSEIAGWYGVAAILTAYVFLNFGVLDAEDRTYQLLNATGALSIVVDAYVQKDWQPLVLNAVWFSIACVTIILSIV